MRLTSSAFSHLGTIPEKYTCEGKNINPPLLIEEIPSNTVSLVLIMDDPDVPPTMRPDGVWNHWLVWDIPPQTTLIAENQNPPGQVGKNTGGRIGYGGPCPPDKEHRYFFKLYALDKTLELSPDSDKKQIEVAMTGHILTQTELLGRYTKRANR